jgi:glutathione S-transferase
MSWIRSDETAALRAERPTSTMFYDPTATPMSAEAEREAKKLVEITERVLRPGASHVFDAWSIVDSELAFILHRLLKNGDPLPARVEAWAEAQWQRPSVRAFIELPRPKLAT